MNKLSEPRTPRVDAELLVNSAQTKRIMQRNQGNGKMITLMNWPYDGTYLGLSGILQNGNLPHKPGALLIRGTPILENIQTSIFSFRPFGDYQNGG
jgi:hypothetical protein